MPIALDVISDTICPWCYIGKRHLESALRTLAGEGLELYLRWHGFQLNPDLPAEGVARAEYRAAKFGSAERAAALDAQVARAAAAAGLQFRLDLTTRTPNTLLSHVLVNGASGDPALQDRVVEALFAAYFTQGVDIGDPAALERIGTAAGLADPAAVLADPVRMTEVRAADRLARGAWIESVPTVSLNMRVLFTGAQPPDAIAAMLRQATAATA